MSGALLLSTVLQCGAFSATLVTWNRLRDWRIGILAGMIGLMAARHIRASHMAWTESGGHIDLWTARLDDLNGLAISIFAFAALVLVGRMIALQDRVTKTLRVSEERYRTLYNQTPVMMHSIDQNSAIESVNDFWLNRLGYAREEVIGRQSSDFLTEASRQHVSDEVLPNLFRAGIVQDVPMQMVQKDGTVIDVLVSAYADHDEAGKVVGARTVSVDVTERKAARQVLETALDRLANAEKIAHIGHWERTMDPDAAFWSDEMYRIFGMEPNSFVPSYQNFLDRIHPDDRERMDKTVMMVRPAENPVEIDFRVLWPNGEIRHLRSFWHTPDIDGEKPKRLLGTLQDVTDWRRAEERFRRYFNLPLVGSAIYAPNKRWIEVNDRFCEIIGYSRAELTDLTWIYVTHPDDLSENLRLFEEAVEGKRDTYTMEKRFIRKNGEIIWTTISVQCLRKADGHPESFMLLVEDITDRKRAEEAARQHQVELARVLRLSTVGEMAAALAHELNQPLAAIYNYARGSLRRLESARLSPQEHNEVLEEIAAESERASQIVRKISRFIRKDAPRMAPVQIDNMIQRVADLARPELNQESVRLELELPTALPQVPADQIEIEQALLNLVRNGVDAMRELPTGKRKLTIGASFLKRSNSVDIAVSDTGPGLPAGQEDLVFDPFFSTKDDGMGMGLAISRTILEAHGGQIWADRDLNQGATFHLTLPTTAEEERDHER